MELLKLRLFFCGSVYYLYRQRGRELIAISNPLPYTWSSVFHDSGQAEF